MDVKKFVPGAAGIASASFLASKLPATLDVGGLPVRRLGAIAAGVYVADWGVTGTKPSLKTTLFVAGAAYLAADLAECAVMSIQDAATKAKVAPYMSWIGIAAGGVGGYAGYAIASKV